MSFIFSKEEIEKIDQTLKSRHQEFEGGWTWTLKSDDNSKPLVFTAYNDVDLGNSNGSLVSVQTRHGYYELHGINSLMYFEPDEIILIKYDETRLSCLIIGSACTCSLYSDISRELLHRDFSELHPAVLLAAMQLSITESLFD
ncbi:MAG: hypothetical protein WC313_07865 [Candidatus Kapaibacterium sp.]|jgi:hypothetical protein|nr:hypothetical protein [Candidatus Kapabacteria bacterium]